MAIRQEPVIRRSAGRAIWWFLLLALIIAGVLIWYTPLWYTPSKNELPTCQPTSTPQAQRKFVYVTGSVVNIREGPSTRFPVVAKVNRGRKLVELTREKDWVKISLEEKNGKSAWIHSSLVSAELAVRREGWITILTAENRARLCPRPNCGQGKELLRIPTNTQLRVLGSHTQRQPTFDVTWYKVKYQEKEGWVCEFNTDKARDVSQR